MAKKRPLRICLATSELAPLAKTGGLADVSAALSANLFENGHDVRVLMPRYGTMESELDEASPVEGLQDLKIQVSDLTFRYSIDVTQLPGSTLPVYLLRCPALFGRHAIYTEDGDEHLRFIVLSRVAIEMCQHMDFAPDIFHCHDWHTALIPLYLKTVYSWDQLFANTKSVLTIHNIGYQGMFSSDLVHHLGLGWSEDRLHQDDLAAGLINFMKTGILYSDLITAVSPTYANEIKGSEYGMGLDGYLRNRSDSVVGILNGVDYDEWNPATDKLIPANYSRGKLAGKRKCKQALATELGLDYDLKKPMIGIVSRLVSQKGIDLLQQALPHLLGHREFSMAILGSGESQYERFFQGLQDHYRDRVCFYRGYNNKLAHCIEAGSDMFLMPSLYEPCGLNQMYSLKYGTVPIVRETGGLADSVTQVNRAEGSGTGVVFRDYDATGLAWAINRGLDLYEDKKLWSKVIDNGMAMDFSWDKQAGRYVELFRQLCGLS